MDTEMSNLNPFVNDMAIVRLQLEKQKVCVCEQHLEYCNVLEIQLTRKGTPLKTVFRAYLPKNNNSLCHSSPTHLSYTTPNS